MSMKRKFAALERNFKLTEPVFLKIKKREDNALF